MPLAALAMAAFMVVLVMDRPAEALAPRTVTGLRMALYSLPQPLSRAARELVGVRTQARMALAPVASSSFGVDARGAWLGDEACCVGWSRPREALIDLPPPALAH